MATTTRKRRTVKPITSCTIVKKYVTGPLVGTEAIESHPLLGGRSEFNHLRGEIGREMGTYPFRFELIDVRKD